MTLHPFDRADDSLLVRVDFACNDDAGNTTGFAQAVQIGHGEPLMELEAPGRGVRMGIAAAQLRIGDKTFPHVGHLRWSGSMAWDGVWMTVEDAATFLLWAHHREWFQMTSGELTLSHLWRSRMQFQGLHLLDQLNRVSREQRGHA